MFLNLNSNMILKSWPLFHLTTPISMPSLNLGPNVYRSSFDTTTLLVSMSALSHQTVILPVGTARWCSGVQWVQLSCPPARCSRWDTGVPRS